jgi:transposase
MKKNHFVGIDISAEKLDVAVINAEQQPKQPVFQVNNDWDGFERLVEQVQKKNVPLNDIWFCFEHTGVYGLLLSVYLQRKGLVFSVVPAMEIKNSMGITRGKNDALDAKRIAEYAATHKLTPTTLPAQSLLVIKQLLTYRYQLVKMRTQWMNMLKSHERMVEVTQVDYVISPIEKQIKQLTKQVHEAEDKIRHIIKEDKELNKNYDLISSVKGIGLIVAAFMLVHTGNFSRFPDARKFNCYVGVAPFEHSSGSSYKGKTKVSPLANKAMKTLLYNSANTAIRADQELKAYYERKKLEGKAHQSIMNAIACKIIGRAFSVVKRKSPYVEIYAQKFNT